MEAVGGFRFYGPMGIIFNGNSVTHLSTLVPRKDGILVICNNNDVGGGNVCNRIAGTLRKFRIARFPKVRTGPRCRAYVGTIRIIGRGGVSFLLTMNKNSIVSTAGFVTISINFRNSP